MEQNIQELWDTYKAVPYMKSGCQKEKKEKGTEEIFEVIRLRISPKLMSDTKPQIQESQRISKAG